MTGEHTSELQSQSQEGGVDGSRIFELIGQDERTRIWELDQHVVPDPLRVATTVKTEGERLAVGATAPETQTPPKVGDRLAIDVVAVDSPAEKLGDVVAGGLKDERVSVSSAKPPEPRKTDPAEVAQSLRRSLDAGFKRVFSSGPVEGEHPAL